ncbi:MAG: integrase core domain-containing protein [Dehalococcoidia bacterium]|jgi:transposase InsO family protein|nr:integrase core domain-containing protein [Dehalococcoidia bacterium]|tara:strand:+ start:1271 stop:1603 length:333 start_codon:yes stop_codon:yes gene_type:complete
MCLPFLVCPTKSNPDNNHCCGDLKNTEKYVMKSVVTNQSTCWDNAPVERFFDSLKREWTGDRSYRTRQQAIADVREYLAVYYNSRRLHSTLGYKKPLNYEKDLNEVSGNR